jgi:hypothetical protein
MLGLVSTKTSMLTSPEAVSSLAERVRAAGRMALDVEFLWERTYAPIPCLAQVATADEIALVDPIEGGALDDVAALLADPDVEVVMHAPSADLTLFALGFGVRPANLLDSQLIAGFVGMGAGQSLGALLGRVIDVKVAKTEGYSRQPSLNMPPPTSRIFSTSWMSSWSAPIPWAGWRGYSRSTSAATDQMPAWRRTHGSRGAR